jgi:hypothetical protein
MRTSLYRDVSSLTDAHCNVTTYEDCEAFASGLDVDMAARDFRAHRRSPLRAHLVNGCVPQSFSVSPTSGVCVTWTAADRVALSGEQIERLNNLTPATGERHEEANMSVIDH